MGKKQHQKDKMYLTTTEWSEFYGGKKTSGPELSKRAEFRRLPFSHCSLTMQPFEHPYCTKEGVCFDLVNILPFLKKFGINPVNGEKMTAKELIKLNFHKNANGHYHCPVTFKIFNENTHIAAVSVSGNVYAYEAIERLNIKPPYWKDLVTDEAFTRADIIHIQDPNNLEKFNFANFYHVKKDVKLVDEEEEKAKKDPRYVLNSVSAETKSILNELDDTYKPEFIEKYLLNLVSAETKYVLIELDDTYKPEFIEINVLNSVSAETKSILNELDDTCKPSLHSVTFNDKEEDDRKFADPINAAHYSQGQMGASFTSTAYEREIHQQAALVDEDILRYQRVKKKAYVRVITSHGPINLELHSDMVPKTCENFLKHCVNGYYKNTVFHRSIRNFMIQGGDPTGTGMGGESIWGGAFKDELKPNLTHTGRGILSMANSGPNTNKSQFFITYRSAKHLDGKHSVFGRVVGGIETLDKMEKIQTDKQDRPVKDIKFLDCHVFVNPYDEADEQLKKDREEAEKRIHEEKVKAKPRTLAQNTGPKTFKKGVGKYINPATQKRTFDDESASTTEAKRKKEAKSKLTDFGAW